MPIAKVDFSSLLVAELEEPAPTVMTTYPSAAVLLARESLAGRLKIEPKEIWTGGETLSPTMRAFVQDAFGCPVVNSYGTSEFLSLAFECLHGSLHLNSDWAILEPVDSRGNPVPPGTEGATTLLTNLANHLQPLIRYDIGDRVTLHANKCACGSVLPTLDVQGRCDDTLQFGSHSGRTVRVLPLALSTIVEDNAGLFDFQVIQQGPSELSLNTGSRGAAASEALRRARGVVSTFLKSQGAAAVHIRCHTGQPPRRGRSGKLQRVVACRV
jgi:phenylacetate-CoA ligase